MGSGHRGGWYKRGPVAPEVSVVIPTYRRDTRLAFTLDALAAQTLDSSRYEVLVVRDDDAEPLGELPKELDVRFITQPAPGPAMRRNRGWQEARGELVAFTDDDCRPSRAGSPRSWRPTATPAPRTWSSRAGPTRIPTRRTCCTASRAPWRCYGPNRWYPTCNLAMPRALLEELGGFDEALAFWGEDTDLGLRAEAGGSRLIYATRRSSGTASTSAP